MAKKAAKRAVGEARGRAYEDLYLGLGAREKPKIWFFIKFGLLNRKPKMAVQNR